MSTELPGARRGAESRRGAGHDQDVVSYVNHAILEAGARDLPEARTLPPAAYFDAAYYEWELEHVLKPEWTCIAHVSQLPNPGDYLAFDLFGESLVVVRGKDGHINTLSRVCQHRGMDIMPQGLGYAERGNTRLFMCPYHSWTYELDGTLKGTPEMQKTASFCRSDYPLPKYRTEVWEGFVFVTFNANAEPVALQYADWQAQIAPWKAGEMELVAEMEWDLAFNWKNMIENWMEPYHHMGIHQKTLQPMMPARGCWTEDPHPHYTRAHLPYRDTLVKTLQEAEAAGAKADGFMPLRNLPDYGKYEWAVHVGFPTFMMATTPDRVIWYRLLPSGPESCQLKTCILVSKEAQQHPTYAQDLEGEIQALTNFHKEDLVVCEAMQRGLHSSAFKQGQLSYLEAPVWCIHKYLATRVQKAMEKEPHEVTQERPAPELVTA
jgi:phenylpropionate dioxygenase-like ring-hydroxylating dioxygenase large terminal subunit